MDDDNDPVAVAFKALDKFIRVLCYLIVANDAFDCLLTPPPDIANKIFAAIFKKLGL